MLAKIIMICRNKNFTPTSSFYRSAKFSLHVLKFKKNRLLRIEYLTGLNRYSKLYILYNVHIVLQLAGSASGPRENSLNCLDFFSPTSALSNLRKAKIVQFLPQHQSTSVRRISTVVNGATEDNQMVSALDRDHSYITSANLWTFSDPPAHPISA